MSDQELFGASASVRIRFDGTIQALAEKLRDVFNISSFDVEPSEYPPHHEIGSAEAFGCEMWLEAVEQESGLFELCVQTSELSMEVFHGRMHDLSPWLARYLTLMCGVAVTPVTPDAPAQVS